MLSVHTFHTTMNGTYLSLTFYFITFLYRNQRMPAHPAGVLFVLRFFYLVKNMEDLTYIPKTIRCPKCKVRVMEYDGRSTMNQIARCRICKHSVVYDVETKEVLLGDIPSRVSTSGLRFY